MSFRSRLVCSIWVVLAALALSASAQQASPPPQPKADAPPNRAWPPEGWEDWIGSLSDSKFEFDRVDDVSEAAARQLLKEKGPMSLASITQVMREAVIAKYTAKLNSQTQFVRLWIKRAKDGSFTGTISYSGSLRPFALEVSGRIEEKGRLSFTEKIDKIRPQFHPWPLTFTGTADGDNWKGDAFARQYSGRGVAGMGVYSQATSRGTPTCGAACAAAWTFDSSKK